MGLVHIYCGDGKGKTTAAMGLAFRALGSGLRVCVCQFLKGAPTGELAALSRFEGAGVLRAEGAPKGFLREMRDEERGACLVCQRELLARAARAEADLVVLDEALSALGAGAFCAEELLKAVLALRQHAEVVLTGRAAPEAIMEAADYVTRMEKLRHPYDRGVGARRGVEY